MSGLRAVVVVPARDGEAHVGAALDALVAQAAEVGPCFAVVLVDDRSTDGTTREARAAAALDRVAS